MEYEDSVYLKDLNIIENTNKPIVLWGTLTLGKIAKRVCDSINKRVVCFGDNNEQQHGHYIWNLPVLPLCDIILKYPDALIIVCSYNLNTVKNIITRLSIVNAKFSFMHPNVIEYIFKIKVLNGTKNVAFIKAAIKSNAIDFSQLPIVGVNTKILPYCRIHISDNPQKFLSELYSVLANVSGIKELECIINSSAINENFVKKIALLADNDKIFSISILTDSNNIPQYNVIIELKKYIFKIKLLNLKASQIGSFLSIIDKAEVIGEVINQVEDNIPPKAIIEDHKVLNEIELQKTIIDYVNNSNKMRRKENFKHNMSPCVTLCYVGAGLGCQILTYLFAKFLAERTDEKIILDDTSNYIRNASSVGVDYFVKELEHTYSLSREKAQKCAEEAYKTISHFQFKELELAKIFNLSLDVLSNYFSEDIWRQYIEKQSQLEDPLLPALLQDKGYNMNVFIENDAVHQALNLELLMKISPYQIDGSYLKNGILDLLINSPFKNKYYYISGSTSRAGDWLLKQRKWIRKQLIFPQITDAYNLKLSKEIITTNSVIIHLRRGELVFTGVLQNSDYYKKSIFAVRKLNNYSTQKYFLFSDSIEWCRENKKMLGLDLIEDDLIYVDGNTGKNSYRDLQLMSMGKILIASPVSAFSFCALLLGKIKKYVDGRGYHDKCQAGCDERELDVDILDILDE